ncbi:MAG: hypothetical protein AAGC60_29525 [Acidobacteriota bacterium]
MHRPALPPSPQRPAVGRLLRLASFSLVLAGLVACAGNQGLVIPPQPAPDTTPPSVATSDEMVLKVDLDAWAEELPQGLVPVWVEVENRGAETLLVRYGGFGLADVTPRGPMPAQALADAAAVEAVESNLAPLGRVEEGDAKKVRILGTTGPTDPERDTPGGIGDRAPAIDDYQHNYWDRFGPPTEVMYERALREIKLAPGKSVSGFLYFPRAQLDEATAFAAELATEGGTGSVRLEASLR